MRVWYSDAYAHQPKDLGDRKLGDHGQLVKFISYPEESAGYKVYNPATHKVLVVCKLLFREEALTPRLTSFETPGANSDDDAEPPASMNKTPNLLTPNVNTGNLSGCIDPPEPAPDPAPPSSNPSPTPNPTQPTCKQCPPQWFNPTNFDVYSHRRKFIANAYKAQINGTNEAKWCKPSTEDFEDIMVFLCNEAHITDTTIQAEVTLPDSPTLCKVLARPEREKWHVAILEELATIKEVEMWELVPLTSTIQNVIGCKFVLQKKRGTSGEVTRFKA